MPSLYPFVQVSGGGALPATLSDALLDVPNADKIVVLDEFGGGAGVTGTQLRTALGLGTGADPMTGAAWTDNAPAGTSVTWAGGKLTLSGDAGVTGGFGSLNANGNTSPEWWDVMCRLDLVSGDGESTANIGLFAGRDENNNVIWILYCDGSYKIGQISGGGYSDLVGRTVANQITSPVRTGGQLWLRLSRSPMGIAVSWGVGVAGVAPTAWTTVYSSANDTTRANLSSGSWVQIAPSIESALAGTLTWDVLAIQSRSPVGWT